jgi:ABC-type transporter Mla subunit MlaD
VRGDWGVDCLQKGEGFVRRTLWIIGAFLLAAGLWFVVRETSTYRLTLHAYYRQAEDVKPGMPVCVDGVALGSVASVTVRPERGDRPVEIVLDLRTPYELRIPGGSTAQIAHQGILRPTVVDIDTRTAGGPPIASGGTIEGRESTDDQAAHALGVVVKALADQSRERQGNRGNADQPPGR